MKKMVLSLVITFCVAFLCNVKVGFTQGSGMTERLDYLETRLSELHSAMDDNQGLLKEHGSILGAIKGIRERVSLGVGLRTSFTTTEDRGGTKTDGVSGGRNYDKDFNIDNMRFYLGAKVTDNITLEINTEVFNESTGLDQQGFPASPGIETISDDIRLLDAFVEYTWNDYFHIRFGRHLPASDRYNLDGPFYQNSFDFPGVVQRYPNKAVGRVEGVSYWGQYKGGKFKWQFTVSEGREIPASANDDEDHFQYSGRLTYNFWEPESGFYNSSTYYGKKDVLAIGLVGFHQSDGVGTITTPGPGTSGKEYKDFNAWNIDFLLEKNFGWGTIDIEAAYFDYGSNGVSGIDDGGQSDGQAWTAGFSYLYPEKIGWGYPQFVSRWQQFDPTDDTTVAGFTESKIELALHYIIQDHNANIALIWSNTHLGNPSPGDNEDVGAVKLGMQFQH